MEGARGSEEEQDWPRALPVLRGREVPTERQSQDLARGALGAAWVSDSLEKL